MAGRCIPTIAIVGGGFSGAAVAWHLRQQLSRPVEIVIIEPRADIGRGLAYSTTDPAHRINVPAVRMNIDADATWHFRNWLIETGYLATDPQAALQNGDLYPSRHAFGTYVKDQIDSLSDSVRRVRTKATNVETIAGGFRVACETGESVEAAAVVLAICHAPPDTPASLASLEGHSRFIANPWAEHALQTIASDDTVLIVGTGLTMADTVASLDRMGHRGRIVAISRRGLRSQPHADMGDVLSFDEDLASPPVANAAELVARIREAIRNAAELGMPWQAVIDRARRQGQDIWRGLPAQERLRLLRHLRPYWDTHRFRIAPQVHSVLQRRLADGSLQITASSVRAHAASPDTITLALRLRHAAEWTTASFNAIVLATGPAHATLMTKNELLSRMHANGLVKPDAFGLGIATDEAGRAVDPAGASSDALFIAGPLARGTFGELMGISDLARYAQKISIGIAKKLELQQLASA